jgi:hypothetical protein
MSIALFCLDGREAPAGITADLLLLAALPERARERFWEALGPALADPLPPAVEASLDMFAKSFGVSTNDLARALKASRFLVREACARGLVVSRFEDDLVSLVGGPLSPEAAVIAPILLSRYEDARGAFQAAITRAVLADHGAVLTSVEWRVDTLHASSRGNAGGSRIAVLTLGYQEAGRDAKLTLQVPPDKLAALLQACERLAP